VYRLAKLIKAEPGLNALQSGRLCRRQLSDDANVEIAGRDLREREAATRALTARIQEA
jgi:hypothetical protein